MAVTELVYTDRKYKMHPDFILRDILGETVIVPVGAKNPMGNAMMSPNESAAFLWKQFCQPRTIKDVVEGCVRRYEAPEDVIVADVVHFVRESMECGVMMEDM